MHWAGKMNGQKVMIGEDAKGYKCGNWAKNNSSRNRIVVWLEVRQKEENHPISLALYEHCTPQLYDVPTGLGHLLVNLK